MLVYWDAVGVLYLADDDDTVEATYAVDVSESVEHKVLVFLHVVGIYFYLKVKVARCIVAFCYLVDVLHSVHKLLYEIVGMLFQPYVAQYDYVVAKLVMVYNSRKPCYIAFALQTFLSLEGGRWRKMHTLGKLLYGHA